MKPPPVSANDPYFNKLLERGDDPHRNRLFSGVANRRNDLARFGHLMNGWIDVLGNY